MASRSAPHLLLALLSTALFAGCNPSSSTAELPASTPAKVLDNSAPAAPAVLEEGERQQRVLAFLAQRYGPAASAKDAWRDNWDDTDVQALRPVHRHLCANRAVMVDGLQYSLLAVCANLDEAASPEPGLIDFIVLRASVGDGMDVVMERRNDTHGNHGVPGEVTVLQLGAQHYGYRIDNTWFGQGYTLQSHTLVALGPDRLDDAGSWRSHIDNSGVYDCDEDDCEGELFDVDFRLAIDDSQPALAVWPLQVSESGTDCAGPVAREHRIAFDPARRSYDIPATLQREGCI